MSNSAKKSLKQRIVNRDLLVGSWVSYAFLPTCEVMARSGFDFLVIDQEHSSIGPAETLGLIQVAQSAGTPVVVRISGHDAAEIKKALDAGADGILVPMVNSAEQAVRVVAAAYYPPRGNRGAGLFRAQGWGTEFATYRERAAKETVVIVQIEHVDGVRNLDAILAVDGVDGFLVGPYDLSASLGKPGEFASTEFKSAMSGIAKALSSSAKPGGAHVVQPIRSDLEARIAEGYRIVAYGGDMLFFSHSLRAEAEAARLAKE